ncbi:MAG: hypothetical protein K2X03_29015 [Bryobacteraceae bacterium]|nr:hypothetical protein [Bryobacteraceae bacterium]
MIAFLVLFAFQDYTYDLNGRKVIAPNQNPDQVEERILEDAGGRKVIERTIRRADGQPEKVRIEERKNADGSVTTETAVYRGDLNGRLNLAEKRVSELRKTATHIEESTVVQRGSLNGGLEVVEKRERSGTIAPKVTQEEVRTFRKDANGGFREAARQSIERREENGKVTENVAEYQAATGDGQLQLSGQKVSNAVKRPDGTTVTQVEVYGMAQPGRASRAGELKLREQQLIEQRPAGGQSVVESFSVRRPDLDGKVSGDFLKVSERTCQKACN